MIRLLVETVSGHFRVPGQVIGSPLGEAATFPIAPPSQIRGAIESLCGRDFETFEGEFAYGRFAPPEGFGILTRRAQVWSTSGDKSEKKGRVGTGGEVIRAIRVPTYFNLSFCIAVRGPWEDLVRAAVRGDVARQGVLSIGESGDFVSWLAEDDSDRPVQWVVPGRRMLLTTRAGRGYSNMTATYGRFDFGSEPAWYGPPAAPVTAQKPPTPKKAKARSAADAAFDELFGGLE